MSDDIPHLSKYALKVMKREKNNQAIEDILSVRLAKERNVLKKRHKKLDSIKSELERCHNRIHTLKSELTKQKARFIELKAMQEPWRREIRLMQLALAESREQIKFRDAKIANLKAEYKKLLACCER